ncbi:MAG: hypothetical protein KBS52_06995 [Clostridiales bacterium]|nr:hypothetical protein [Candidatus Equinaster intestinalis]
MIYFIVSFAIAAFAFGFGAAKLFKKGKPLYLQILVCAAGCFAIEQMSLFVNIWCNIQENVSINMLGVFGCNLFLLSANLGAIDKIVTEGKTDKKIQLLSLIAPVVTGGLAVATFFVWKKYDMFFAVVGAAVLLPAVPASYYNLKHILLPIDSNGFLRATKPCNIFALVFYLLNGIVAALAVYGDLVLDGILSVVMSVSVLLLVIFAVRGAKQWEI